MEQLEIELVNWYNFGKLLAVSTEVKHILTLRFSKPTPRYMANKNEYIKRCVRMFTIALFITAPPNVHNLENE